MRAHIQLYKLLVLYCSVLCLVNILLCIRFNFVPVLDYDCNSVSRRGFEF
jgi:hypothetical protein